MSKRAWLVLLIALLGLAGGLLGILYYAGRSPETVLTDVKAPVRQPTPLNLILITLDTTRADHLGVYGYGEIKTPNIDTLARGGIFFRRAIAPAPITLPSHCSIMTGLYPPSHGVRDNGTFYLPDEITTLAEVLKKEGYATGAFVGAAVLEKKYGLAQGFDIYDDDFSRGRRRRQFMYAERPCDQVVEAALRWLEEKVNNRFFAWLHFYDPHAGYDPPDPWATEYEEIPYDGEIAYTDTCLGGFFDALRKQGVWKDSLVILTADHGESLGEHGEKTHGLFIYDATLHVPLIFYSPSLLPAGRSVGRVISTVDIFPTILSLLGVRGPGDLDGKDLLPLMRGQRDKRPGIAYSETLLPKYHYGWAELKGITSRSWKLIEAPRPELYHLTRDPRELVNIYERNSRTVRELNKTLAGIGKKNGLPESRLEIDPETAEQLRALGYIWMPSPSEEKERDTPPDPKDMIPTHLHVQQGRNLIRQERFDEAIAEFNKVLTMNPKSLSTYLDLASAYLAKDEPEKARQPLATALDLDPQNHRVYNLMGVVENRLGNREEALRLFQRAAEKYPRFEEAYVNIAALWERAGELDKAEEAVKVALKITPKHAGAHNRLGSILLARGNKAGAEAEFREALKTNPYYALAHRNLGVMYDQEGRYEEALAAYQEALKCDDRLANVHQLIGTIYTKQGRLDQAEVQIKEALRINPKLAEGYISLGIVYDKKEVWEKALEANEQALKLNPQAYQAYGNMAVIYIKQGEYDKAEEALKRVLKIKPDYPEAYNNLAVLYLERGKAKEARAAAGDALKIRPDYPEALTNLGIIYDKQGQLTKAVDYHQKALSVNPAYWEARNNLAITFLHMGRYGEAEEEFVKVLRTQPNLPAVHKHLGDLYFEHLKAWDKARKHYRIYLRLVSSGKERQEIEARLQKMESS